MKTHEAPSSSKGFTLIELLVVIAIIALLLAIFAPTMGQIKLYAKMMMCAKRMNQVGVSQMSYASENKRHLPGPNWRRSHSRGWLYSDLKMDELWHLETGQLWPFQNSYESYRCPDDKVEPPVYHRPNNSRMITSYCMNGSVCGYGRRALITTSEACQWHPSSGVKYWDTYRFTDFDANDIIIWEADETTGQKGWWHDGSNYPWEGITNRHLYRGNTVCADGHAEWLLLDDYYSMNIGSRTRLWCNPGTANGH